MQDILSSMDKITKKTESKKSVNEKPDEQELAEKSAQEKEKELALQRQREEEKKRQQKRRNEVLKSQQVENSNAELADLTSDEWGTGSSLPSHRNPIGITAKELPAADADEHSDENDLPDPVPALDDVGGVDDDEDDDFDLPVPVPAVPLSPRTIIQRSLGFNENQKTKEENKPDMNYDNVNCEDDNIDGYDDDDDCHIDKDGAGEVCDSISRSRTPSPFLSTNKYYPEYYAKKERSRQSHKTISKANSNTVLNSAFLDSGEIVASVPKPVPPPPSSSVAVITSSAPPSVKVKGEQASRDKTQTVQFPMDIDRRIAKFFQDKRSKEKRKKKKLENEVHESTVSPQIQKTKGKELMKDFDIDTNSSFMLNPAELLNPVPAPARAGLGQFLSKVISTLKETKDRSHQQAFGSSDNDNSDRYSDDIDGVPLRLPPLGPVPPPPPPGYMIPQPVPPPPPPVQSYLDLEPGEIPSSPEQSDVPDMEDNVETDNSTINIMESDLDDATLFQIVDELYDELDDTLEEEEKLKRAKEKLAKHLLKNKSYNKSKSSESLDKNKSVRKQMISQLPSSRPDEGLSLTSVNDPSAMESSVKQPMYSNRQPEDNDFENFASTWGVSVSRAHSESKAQQSDNANAMSSALEKLRNFSKRSMQDSFSGENGDYGSESKRTKRNESPYLTDGVGNYPEYSNYSNRFNIGPRDEGNAFLESPFIESNRGPIHGMGRPALQPHPEPIHNPRFANRHDLDDKYDAYSSDRRRGPGQFSHTNNGYMESDNSRGSSAEPNMGFQKLKVGYENLEGESLVGEMLYAELLQQRITTETEYEYLDRFMRHWKSIVSQLFSFVSLEFNRTMELKKEQAASPSDLGKEFNDFRLNLRVLDKQGEEKDVFTSCLTGTTLTFRCAVCDISVFGKRNIESHMQGRRHFSALANFQIVGMFFMYFRFFFCFCGKSLHFVCLLNPLNQGIFFES